MKTRLLLLSTLCTLSFSMLSAAPPVVTLNSLPIQRPGTKLVDLNYTLALDPGQTAFVEMWFSPDNGLNFPIQCINVMGDVGPNMSSGSKSATWNAEIDWDQQFTSNGRIRVIATYGNQPSGFTGSGTGNSTNSSGQATGNLKQVFMDVLWTWDAATGAWIDNTSIFQLEKVPPSIKIDATEVTNAEWDSVVQWALTNGYTGLPLSPIALSPDLPRTDITIWQVIKWCNARSEKQGRSPAYFTDLTELNGDFNGDGIISNGPDGFNAFGADDLNQNGQWDPGESFTDNNGNGIFDGQEYFDINGNTLFDPGHTTPFRQGSNILVGQDFHRSIDQNATGFRLPSHSIRLKIMTGGSNQTKWPWGNTSPDTYAPFTAEYYVPQVSASLNNAGPPLTGPSVANFPANGYHLKDTIGNVAEFEEYVHDMSGGSGTSDYRCYVYGGSYLGLKSVHPNPSATTFMDNSMPVLSAMFDLMNEGSASASSSAIGFRTWRP